MKTIRYNYKENQSFNIDLIESIKIKSLFSNEWLDSEHWGWNDEGENGQPFCDFGCFGEIMFDISKTGMRLYFPHAINFFYSIFFPNKLYAQPYNRVDLKELEQSPFSFDAELNIDKPITNMFDLRNHLQGFVIQCINDIEDLKIKHDMWINRPINIGIPTVAPYSDLPF